MKPPQIFEREYYDRLKAIESDHWWTLGMLDIMEAMLAGRLPVRPGARFLDIGCGSGIGLSWAARRLPEALRLGVDVSPLALEHCRGLGAELQRSSASELPFRDDSIDLALCLDVLQHLDDETPALREARRVLRTGGLMYLRTNALSLGPPPPGSRLFTPQRLERGLADAGLDVVLCSKANAAGALVADGQAWLRRRRPERAEEPPEAPGDHGPGPGGGGGYGGGLRIRAEGRRGIVSGLKRGLLQAEGRWIRRGGRLPVGHSLVCVARKPVAERPAGAAARGTDG